jgi:hypothetical protein
MPTHILRVYPGLILCHRLFFIHGRLKVCFKQNTAVILCCHSMTSYPNPTKNQQNPMARFETGPMNRKPMASDLLKTKQSKNKKFEAKQKTR